MKTHQRPRSGLYYHLTPYRNIRSILERGLLCKKSRSPIRRIWLCTSKRIGWALKHIAIHHGVDQSELVLCQVVAYRKNLIRVRHGIYASYEDLKVESWRLNF